MSHRGSISFENGHKKCDSTALTTCFYTVRGVLLIKKKQDGRLVHPAILLEYLYETVDIDRKAY